MSDKYEELANLYVDDPSNGFLRSQNLDLADAFRWYDARREKEVCEWVAEQTGRPLHIHGESGKRWFDCPWCAYRIVEKESK